MFAHRQTLVHGLLFLVFIPTDDSPEAVAGFAASVDIALRRNSLAGGAAFAAAHQILAAGVRRTDAEFFHGRLRDDRVAAFLASFAGFLGALLILLLLRLGFGIDAVTTAVRLLAKVAGGAFARLTGADQ